MSTIHAMIALKVSYILFMNDANTIQNTYELRKVQGLESSVGVVLPKKYSADLGIRKGNLVKLRLDGSRIILEKVEI